MSVLFSRKFAFDFESKQIVLIKNWNMRKSLNLLTAGET